MFGFNQPQQIECPEEHAQGTLPGSVNVPLQVIQHAHQQLDKSKPVIVYCVSGARSAQAQSVLQSMGFDNVHNLGSIRKYLSC
jgi:phage shock protein E